MSFTSLHRAPSSRPRTAPCSPTSAPEQRGAAVRRHADEARQHHHRRDLNARRNAPRRSRPAWSRGAPVGQQPGAARVEHRGRDPDLPRARPSRRCRGGLPSREGAPWPPRRARTRTAAISPGACRSSPPALTHGHDPVAFAQEPVDLVDRCIDVALFAQDRPAELEDDGLSFM